MWGGGHSGEVHAAGKADTVQCSAVPGGGDWHFGYVRGGGKGYAPAVGE